jgi:hypothetical protein|tara:strand:+ start:711 stop:980 length:270 start_codon:yes stop_codon:yes gene_type:complete
MKKETYVKRMKANEERFDKLWRKIVDDTNKYIEKNPEDSMYGFQNNVLNFSDYMCKSGAWIQDRINGKMPRDRGSLTKKIRKALGYTFP